MYLLALCEDCHQERQLLENDARLMIGQIASCLTNDALFGYVSALSQDVMYVKKEAQNA